MNNDLISREALKEHKFVDDKFVQIGARTNDKTLENINKAYQQGWNDCIDAIVDNAPTVEERPQGEWIPITEKLPNTLGVYNVTRKLKEGETIYFISDASYFDGQNTWYADTGINHSRPYLTDITAWRPLPEPYKKGEEE